ncbi:hypothetical protein R1flu_019742 [Riccia fluitans]|uniref:Uncharacterized protein n=1 Tax=Riccia fluitans TaxID=41844 RepID=A0ABD1ZJJ0_9MARC
MLRTILGSNARGGFRRGTVAPLSSAGFHFPFSTHSSRKYSSPKGVPTLRQKRIASEVKEVISEALQQGPCENPNLRRAGFEITDVEMSSDLRTAHVLWRALPGMQKSAEKAVLSNVKRLRSLVFSRLTLPFSPTLKFQEDAAPLPTYKHWNKLLQSSNRRKENSQQKRVPEHVQNILNFRKIPRRRLVTLRMRILEHRLSFLRQKITGRW